MFFLFAVALFVLPVAFAARTSAEEDPARPAAIETTSVPKVPQEILKQLASYQSIRGVGFAGWSPTNDGMLIRTRFANTAQLHRVYMPGGRREQITFDKEPVKGRFIKHATDGVMLLSKSDGGNEQFQVLSFNPKTHSIQRLTNGKSRNSATVTSPDGKQVIIHSTMRNGRDSDMYISDARNGGTMELLFSTNQELWYTADWSSDGTKLLMGQHVSANESYLGLFDLKTKKHTKIVLPGSTGDKAVDGKISSKPVGFTLDVKAFYLTSDLNSEFSRLGRYDIETKKLTWLSGDIDWNVEDVAIHKETGRVAFVVNEDGSSKLYVLEEDKPRMVDLPMAIINGLEFSPDGKTLGLTLSPPNGTSDAYSIDFKTGKLTRWTFSELGGLNTDEFILPTRIHYKSFDSREIAAFYYKPQKASKKNPAPVFIKVHGGPESQTRPYFSREAQFLCGKLGVAYIAPNVRGSKGYGKTFLKLDNWEKREDSVKDIGALLDWIKEQPDLDENRVMISGGSYGGYMVLASLTHYPDRIKAGIDSVGIANFITFLEKTKAYRRHLRRVEYGDETDPKMRAFFERINPTANAHKIKAALMVVHGTNDPRVPFFEAQQIAGIVKSKGLPVWTVYATNEGHGFRKKDNRDYLKAVELMFVKKFLELE